MQLVGSGGGPFHEVGHTDAVMAQEMPRISSLGGQPGCVHSPPKSVRSGHVPDARVGGM